MTREEALDILGLSKDTSQYEIEKRFTVLVKRSHIGNSDPETDKRVSEAYTLLSGQTVEAEVIPEKLQRVFLGKSLYQWKNIAYYGRWTVLVTVIIVVFLGAIVHSVVNRDTPGIKVAVVGEMVLLDTELNSRNFPMRTYARQTLNIAEADVRFLPVKELDDTEESMAVRMQMSLILAGVEPQDLFFTNDFTFPYYSVSGVFRPLEDVYETLRNTLDPDLFDKIIPRYGVEMDIDNKPVGEPYMMGLEITGTWLAEGLGFRGRQGTTVVSLGTYGKNPDNAAALLYALFRDQEMLEEQGRELFEKRQASLS